MKAGREPASVRSANLVWAGLIAMTLMSFAAFEIAGAIDLRRVAAALIMAISGVKAYLVFRYFMGLGAGPRSYRFTFMGWIVFCAAVIAIPGVASLR